VPDHPLLAPSHNQDPGGRERWHACRKVRRPNEVPSQHVGNCGNPSQPVGTLFLCGGGHCDRPNRLRTSFCLGLGLFLYTTVCLHPKPLSLCHPPLPPSQIRNVLECSGCGRTDYEGHLRACSACKKAAYCSQACQKAHWKVHKPECKKASTKK
jgi:hypothetical protein